MAIDIQKELDGKVVIRLDNGHAEALAKIVNDYNLLGEKEALGFMLSILSQAGGEAIKIKDASLVPSDRIKKPATKDYAQT